MKYEDVKRWVTIKRAQKDEDVIKTELQDLMREYMELSSQGKFFGHKTLRTDKGFWKLRRSHTDRRDIRYDCTNGACPMRHWCRCEISLRVVTGHEFIELQRHGLHDTNSHEKDESKKLTCNQIVSAVEAVKTAPTLSCAVLSRNLLDHDSPTKTIPVQLKR